MGNIENNKNKSLQKEVLHSTIEEKEVCSINYIQQPLVNNKIESSKLSEGNSENLIDEDMEYKDLIAKSSGNEGIIKIKSFIYQSVIIAFPGILFHLYLLVIHTSNFVFIEQKYNNDKMIQGIGLCNSLINCTLMAIYTGLISGLETLYPNAYAVKKYRLMGYYYQRARIIGYAICILISVIHLLSCRKLFSLLGFDKEVVDYAYEYVIASIIYCILDVQAACALRVINVLEKVEVNMIILFISMIFHPLWNYIFIIILDMKIIGAGISMVISKFINFFLCTVYLWFWHPCSQSNFWINRKCFELKGIIYYLKFSIGLTFLICAEWWGFELLAFIAMFLTSDDYTVYILLSNISDILYSLPLGFNMSITIQIGELISKSPIKTVKKACYISVLFSFSCMVIYVGIYIIFRKPFFTLFAEDQRSFNLGDPCLIWVGISELVNMFQISLISIMRGLGKQYIASIFLFFNFYIVTNGLAFLFGHWLKLGVIGMWYGITISYFVASIIYMTILCLLDFNKCRKETLLRIIRDNKLVIKEQLCENVSDD